MASYLRQAREWATPTLKDSAFLTRGVLTPEEFVRAGDELVYKCPTWSWAGGDSVKLRSHLPKDKQYLITRNVPCPERASEIENAFLGETEVEIPTSGDGGDEGWLVSHMAQKPDKIEDEFDIVDAEGDLIPKEEEPPIEEEEEDEYADMADFEDDNVLVDEDTAKPDTVSAENESNILKTRTYDLTITYDKYYQTPRVFMFGYHSDGTTLLTADEMFEDVMSDYVRRTVTMETHPHLAGQHASIHPCQHGAVMKTIVSNLGEASVEQYMFIFLKFVSTMIPTIRYDFTMEVEANTQKKK
eukprot:CAMPEP_0172501608 /NCGR_PEP_ID=MMETSP1066-20121228/151434_1 /TAXON_ID=671091 /ORGANISM="Coscinodiscus wailesii, Strain CCMP2513" /LENGTH=299 /DNA_ID=CAMNT_0013276499 /DNA_START=108 /DNA_END=1007 /DNA_ORIENTATION=+